MVNKFLDSQDKMTYNMPYDNETKCFKVFLVFEYICYERHALFCLPFWSTPRPLNLRYETHCIDSLGDLFDQNLQDSVYPKP